jgi:hypothetical protein
MKTYLYIILTFLCCINLAAQQENAENQRREFNDKIETLDRSFADDYSKLVHSYVKDVFNLINAAEVDVHVAAIHPEATSQNELKPADAEKVITHEAYKTLHRIRSKKKLSANEAKLVKQALFEGVDSKTPFQPPLGTYPTHAIIIEMPPQQIVVLPICILTNCTCICPGGHDPAWYVFPNRNLVTIITGIVPVDQSAYEWIATKAPSESERLKAFLGAK